MTQQGHLWHPSCQVSVRACVTSCVWPAEGALFHAKPAPTQNNIHQPCTLAAFEKLFPVVTHCFMKYQSLLTILASCLQWILICIVLSSAGRHTPLFGLCCHGTRCHPACHGTFQTCARRLKVNLDSTAQYSQKRNVQNELLAYNAVFSTVFFVYYISNVTLKCFCYSLMRNWHNTLLCCHIIVKLDKMSQSGLIVCCTYTGKCSDRLSFLYIVCEK